MSFRALLLLFLISIRAMAQDVPMTSLEPGNNATSHSPMHIEIWSDISCPFCYLGKKNFETALAESGFDNRVSITWKSYQLNPGMHTEPGLSLFDFLKREKGWDKSDVQATESRLNQAGKTVGIEYRFDKVVVANTYRAHALLQFAEKHGKQEKVGERLFKAYFTEGLNVDDVSILISLAGECGLDISGLEKSLSSNAFDSDIQSDITEAERLNIRGVPYFLIDRKLAVSGAQDPEVFLDALKKASGEK